MSSDAESRCFEAMAAAFSKFRKPSCLYVISPTSADVDAKEFSCANWKTASPKSFVGLRNCFHRLSTTGFLFLLPDFLEMAMRCYNDPLVADVMETIIFKLAASGDALEIAGQLDAEQRQTLLGAISKIEQAAFPASGNDGVIEISEVFSRVPNFDGSTRPHQK